MDRRSKRLMLTGQAIFYEPDAISANAGACGIVSDVSLSGLTGGALTVAAQPDYPRALRCVLTDADGSITGGTVTLVGVDANGEGITDVVTFTGAGTVDGVKAFAKLTSATWALTGGSVTETDDKIAIGLAKALGLPSAPGATFERLIKATYDGGDEAGTLNTTYGTYTPAGTLDASDEVEVLYLFSVPLDVF